MVKVVKVAPAARIPRPTTTPAPKLLRDISEQLRDISEQVPTHLRHTSDAATATAAAAAPGRLRRWRLRRIAGLRRWAELLGAAAGRAGGTSGYGTQAATCPGRAAQDTPGTRGRERASSRAQRGGGLAAAANRMGRARAAAASGWAWKGVRRRMAAEGAGGQAGKEPETEQDMATLEALWWSAAQVKRRRWAADRRAAHLGLSGERAAEAWSEELWGGGRDAIEVLWPGNFELLEVQVWLIQGEKEGESQRKQERARETVRAFFV